MKKVFFVASAFVLLLTLATGTPAHAGGALCSANPTSGPPGTVFTISCSGFDAYTNVNAYVVEPDGKDLSTEYLIGVDQETFKTDKSGSVSFVWASEGGTNNYGGVMVAHQFGAWTFVVHELGLGNTIVAEGQTTVQLTNKYITLTGAALSVVRGPLDFFAGGWNWELTGSGFAPNEAVNLWMTMPPNCSGHNANPDTAQGWSAVDGGSGFSLEYIGGVGTYERPTNTIKADSAGNIAFIFVLYPYACTGDYFVTARALGSGHGAEASIVWSGQSVTATGSASLSVSPDNVPAIGSPVWLTLNGSGFPSGAGVNCWLTRPDGRVFDTSYYEGDFLTTTADKSGSFSLSVPLLAFAGQVSEEPGVWSATCATPDRSALALTTFTVFGLASDP